MESEGSKPLGFGGLAHCLDMDMGVGEPGPSRDAAVPASPSVETDADSRILGVGVLDHPEPWYFHCV